MIRTEKEIDELASNGTPSEIVDAMTAYEDHIRELESQIGELTSRLIACGNTDLRELEMLTKGE